MRVRDLIANSIWLPPGHAPATVPKASVLLSTHRGNANGQLRRCVESLLAQSLQQIELLITDDSATEETFDLIRKFMARDARIGCIRHPQSIGLPAIAGFEAYRKARADLIFFAFDDNEFNPNALADLVSAFSETQKSIVYGFVDFHLADKTSQKGFVVRHFGGVETSPSTLLSHNYIPGNAVLVHRRVFENIGWYDPHIVNAHHCSWDMWKRAAESYEIVSVSVPVGRNHGPLPEDDLKRGNGTSVDAVEELTRQPERNHALLPGNFPDYDVLACPPSMSKYFRLVFEETRLRFADKYWMKDSAQIDKTEGTIMVVMPAIDASATLCFTKLGKLEPRLRIIHADAWPKSVVVGAKAVIFVRNLFGMRDWIDLCRESGIPHYFFLDDNFCMLAATNEIADFAAWRNLERIRAQLASFSGLLLTTPKLIAWFRENNMHGRLELFPPILQHISCRDLADPPKEPGEIRIAYIGGLHRRASFLDYVVPAIRKLSESSKIVLYAVGIEKEHLEGLASDRVRIACIPVSLSYLLMMQRLVNNEIDILVHPGPQSVNNAYKTANVLLNGVILNAAVIASDTLPYTEFPASALRVCASSEEDWHHALKQISGDESLRQNMLAANRAYCETQYGGEINNQVIAGILERHGYVGILRREDRFKDIMNAVFSGNLDKDRIKRAIKTRIENGLKRMRRHKIVLAVYIRIRHLRVIQAFINGLRP